MNDILELFVFFGSLLLFVFCYKQLRKSLLIKDWSVFFWGGVIYFICVPFLVDGSLILLGDFESFHRQYSNENPLYWNGVTLVILANAILFSLIFIFIFYIFDLFFKQIFRDYKYGLNNIYDFRSVTIFIIFIISIIPCLSLLNDGADFIENQRSGVTISALSTYTGVFLPLSAVMIYYCLLKKKYIWVVLFTIPLLVLSVVGQSRTLFFYIPAAYLMAYFQLSKKEISIQKLILILISLLMLSQMIKIFVNENYGFSDSDDKISFLIAKSFRDVSIGDFYYSIDVRSTLPELTTEGKSTLALIATGIVPPMLDRSLFDPQNTVTYRIYQLRFGDVDFGSMHPTLIGYSFFDLGWFGFILAIIIPFVLRLYQFITSRFTYTSFISPVMISAFMFVALRGSVNVAYSKLVYGGITIFLILSCMYFIDRMITVKEKG